MQKGIGSFMLKKLRGRNLGHPGCLVGITTGLTLGIVLAGILASVYNVALNTVLLVWFGLTIGLGAIGWIVGDRLSARFPALEETSQDDNFTSPTTPKT
jgi:hypothetical protein